MPKAVISAILRRRRNGNRIVLLAEAAAAVIGMLKDGAGQATTHWENKSILMETYVGGDIADTIAERQDGMITAAGMATTFDVMLAILSEMLPAATVRTVSAVCLHDRIRPFDTPQPSQRAQIMTRHDPVLQAVIESMEARLDQPTRIAGLARSAGTTTRSLERKFQRTFGLSPLRFLRELRLNKALGLVTETDMPLIEIALVSGIGSADTLSRLFRQKFGSSPIALRRRRIG